MPENPMLRDEVRRVLRDCGHDGRTLTFAKASEITGISASMIHAMAQGKVVGCEGIIRFARAFDLDIAAWLDMSGYEDIAAVVREGKVTQQTPNEFDTLLERIPATRRRRAREDARKAIEQFIIPLYTERAA